MSNLATNHTDRNAQVPSPEGQAFETIFYVAGFVLMVATILASLAIVGFIVYVAVDVVFHVGSPHWSGLQLPWK